MVRAVKVVAALLAVAAVAVLSLYAGQAEATAPTYCTKHEAVQHDCNCHQCNCQTCHTCSCHTNKVPWTDCDFGDCGDHGCWCSPVCKCCYNSVCTTQCNCETCCDTCTVTQCTHLVTYEVHSVEPAAVVSTNATSITLVGGFFVNTHAILCRFGATTVVGTLVTNNAVRCTAPNITLGAGNTTQVPVAVSLDGGEHWTDNDVSLTYYNCLGACSGHGECGVNAVCACEEGYVGAACELTCPSGTAGSGTCSGHGSCSQAGACECDDGYWGTACGGTCPRGTSGNVCSGRGACSASDGKCICEPGFIGDACEHTGSCTDGGDCTCSEKGYWGTGCAKTCPGSDNCSPGTGCDSTCSDHGLCGHNGTCICAVGFYGKACATACPSSGGLPCAGHTDTGSCDAGGICTCQPGWYGTACDLECPGGHATPCSNHGTCTSVGTCVCENGYIGTDCSQQCPLGALNVVCSGQGTCLSDGTCQCRTGYYGSSCNKQCPGGAANPCNGRGSCDALGQCVCQLGYYGAECAGVCPGGATSPCSGHGNCDPTAGTCNCNPGYFGNDCNSECPKAADGSICNDHGTCNPSTGKCKCDTWYSGPACDTVECPYNCYGHGTCNAQGQCSCNTAAGWGGIYCSKQETGPTVGVAQFIFTPPTYHVAEDTGTIYLNVSRGGSTAGTVYVSYKTKEVSAKAGMDFEPTAGKLEWKEGDAVKTIQVNVLGDDAPEGIEIFEIVLIDPSPNSTVGQPATVIISASDNAQVARESVFVTIVVDKAVAMVEPSTHEGAQFAADFATDLAGPSVLNCDSSRIVVDSVAARDGASSTFTFYILDAVTTTRADELARLFIEQMRVADSALYSGKASRYIDITYEPVLRFVQEPATPESTSYAWIAGIIIPLVLIGTCVAVGYFKRRQLTEWLLWRLGNFRFHTMVEHRADKFDEDDDDEDNRL